VRDRHQRRSANDGCILVAQEIKSVLPLLGEEAHRHDGEDIGGEAITSDDEQL
jgi:hypothetical protein